MMTIAARLRPTQLPILIAGLVLAAMWIARLDDRTGLAVVRAAEANDAASPANEPDPSPVDLVLTPNEQRAVTANQQSGSLALVDLADGRVLAEAACGERPGHLAITPDGNAVLATAADSGELFRFSLANDRLDEVGRLRLGREPRGVAVSPDGTLAYVALAAAATVAVIDLESWQVLDEIAVGRWPRFLALSPDGRRLAVGCSGDRGVSVVDTERREQLQLQRFAALNLGQMHVSADGRYVYFPWIVSRQFAITPGNIRRGWVLASRIARVRLDEQSRREAISLDPQGLAVGDPHGLALSPDGQTLVCTASGTHELLVYRLSALPFQSSGGPDDHIDPELLKDRDRFDRIELGGRPLTIRYSQDGNRVFVVNALLNAIQVVHVGERRIVRTIALGESSPQSLARRGDAIFHDARRSLDQWYSCHSCHYEGGGQAVTIDTQNDGRSGNAKTVLSLRGAVDTGPWFWHGWSDDLPAAVRKSMTDTMLGTEPTAEDVEAVVAYLRTLSPPSGVGELSEAAVRGRAVFESEKAGCANCHPAPHFTDGQRHDVGLGSPEDYYPTYNTPSLLGVSRRVLFLHDGRAQTLRDVLTGPHNPSTLTGLGELSDAELADLLAYLESL